MNIYKVTVRTENKNTDTNVESLVSRTEKYFSEYTNADKFCETYGTLKCYGDVNNGGELRCGKFSADQYAKIFDSKELVSRTVINIVLEKLQ
jgi:hypothetical protein